MWKSRDPREVFIDWDCMVKIIIVDLAINKTYIGEVSVEYSYSVWTDNPEKKYISADDEWPGSWIWTRYPNREDVKDD